MYIYKCVWVCVLYIFKLTKLKDTFDHRPTRPDPIKRNVSRKKLGQNLTTTVTFFFSNYVY